MDDEPTLVDKMRTLAMTHPSGPELLEQATKLELTTNGYFSEPQTHTVRQFLGSWARSRKLYCECSGEPLV